MGVRVALVQLRITDQERPEARRERVLDVIAGLSGRADLVILPELWLTGAFATQDAIDFAEPLDGPTFTALAQAAQSAQLHLLAGSLAEAHGARPYNTAVVFGPDGDVVARYRKMHLFGFDGGEAAAFTAGPATPVVWDSPWGRFGLATCYDLRFPELFRAMVDLGAIGFLVPTGWPTRRMQAWEVLVQARAMENQAWFIGVNAVGSHAGFEMGGYSVLVGPDGHLDYAADRAEGGVAILEVNPAEATEWRARFPALRDRRL